MELLLFFQYVLNGVSTGMGYALLALGLSLVFGVLHIVNFTHGEFYMLGGYLSFVLMRSVGLPYFIAMPLAVIAVVVLAFICSLLIIQPLKERPFLFTLIATFGLGYVFSDSAFLIWGGLPKCLESSLTGTLRFAGLYLAEQNLLIILVSLTFLLGMSLFVKKSNLGKKMRATNENKVGAALVGVNISSIYNWTFVIGSGLAALSGVLIGALTTLLPYMGEQGIFTAFIVVIIGGMGSIIGSLLGGLILGLVQSLGCAYISPALTAVFGFGAAILILLLRPRGLLGPRES